MKSITLKAPAKINLGLSILGKLASGYHEVKTIYGGISLFDEIKMTTIVEDKIEIKCNDKYIPTDKSNLAYQAGALIKKTAKLKKGAKILINKQIPAGAGLGGGSSDAAIVLRGLNQLWRLKLSREQLIKLAKKIGADVAYFIQGGVQLEYQGGKKSGKFTLLPKLPPCTILVCFPKIKITSKKAYGQINYQQINKNNLCLLIKAIKENKLKNIANNLHNDFEIWALNQYPTIKQIKEKMIRYGALGSLMSGKGSAVFGLFDNQKSTLKAYKQLRKRFKQTFLCQPI